MIHIDHLPYEYDPILKRIGLTILADGRVSASQVFLRNLMHDGGGGGCCWGYMFQVHPSNMTK